MKKYNIFGKDINNSHVARVYART